MMAHQQQGYGTLILAGAWIAWLALFVYYAAGPVTDGLAQFAQILGGQ